MRIVILLLVAPLMLQAQLFEKGNELYKQQKYTEAVEVYQQILKQGQHSSELYYNLGNAYYKLNQIAPAIYNYERALMLSPDDSKIKNNLKFAQNMMIAQVKEVQEVGFNQWLHKTFSIFHYNIWGKLSIIGSILVLLCFSVYYFWGNFVGKRVFFSFSVLFFVITSLVVWVAWFEKNQAKIHNPAIVFQHTVGLLSEPNKQAQTVQTLYEGTKVYIIQNEADFSEVRLPNGITGWLPKESVQSLLFDLP